MTAAPITAARRCRQDSHACHTEDNCSRIVVSPTLRHGREPEARLHANNGHKVAEKPL
jgi:hypothetical protein